MGNYSKNPQDVLQDAQAKGYGRVRFQQGKPILDRELNLVGDLAGAAFNYIGNGVPAGSNAFKITFANPGAFPQTDFNIGPGTCVVNGHEVTTPPNTTYKTQPHKEHVIADPFPANSTGWVYIFLRVFTREVNGADDAGLGNAGDVGFETALREKVDWEVLLLKQNEMEQVKNRPDYFPLAFIFYGTGPGSFTVSDLRAIIVSRASLVEVFNAELTFPRRPVNTQPTPQGVSFFGGGSRPRFFFISVTTDINGGVDYTQSVGGGHLSLSLTPQLFAVDPFKAYVKILELVLTGPNPMI